MNFNLAKYTAIAAVTIMSFSCNDKAKEAETSEAETVAVSETTGIDFTVDTTSSKIEWKGFKPTSHHFGTVSINEGSFKVNNGTIESGMFIIDMNSIAVNDLEGNRKANLENHLMGTVEGKEGDFFNVREYPTATFEVTEFSKGDDGKTLLSGNLNLKGKKNNITIPVNINENGENVVLESEPFTIDRTKWDVNFGSKSIFDNLGDNFINDDIELKITINANKA